jgi:hypothetical protein
LLNSATIYLGGVAPYHWLDFINNRALYAGADVGNVTGATGYSFTRASDGYYTNSDGTLTLFGSGALRRGDRGVLIEGARTNLLTYSQQFDGVNWTTSRGTVTANASTAPDGTLTADRFVCNSTSVLETGVRQATSQAISTAHTVSVFAKYRSARYLVLRNIALTGTVAQECAYFDLLNGVVATRGAFVTSSSIRALANGWYLCTATGTTAAVIPNNLVDIRTSDADGSFSNTLGTEVDLWQADLQAGAFPSSPIVTVAAAATRAADVLTYTVNTTAQINAAVAGQAELVTNGGFAADADWTKGTGWTITGGAASFTATGAASALSQSISGVTAGKAYVIQYTVVSNTLNAGNFRVGAFSGNAAFGSSVINLPITVGAQSVLVLPTPAGAGNILDTHVSAAATSGTLTIDNLSVKEVPANSLTLYPLQLWSEFERAVDTGGDEIVASLNATASDRTDLYVSSADLVRVFMRAASVTQADVATSGSIAINTATKAAARAATNDVNIAKDGTAATADTTATLPTNPTELRIGLRVDGAQPLFGYIRRVAVIQGAGTDAQLQSMTGS